jgi:hypothetical protein
LSLHPTIRTPQRPEFPGNTIAEETSERQNRREASARVGTFAMLLRSIGPGRFGKQYQNRTLTPEETEEITSPEKQSTISGVAFGVTRKSRPVADVTWRPDTGPFIHLV